MNYSKEVKAEIQKSIDEIEKHTTVEGSEALYERLIAKFTSIDPDFARGVPNNGKLDAITGTSDYRPEINAIREKLKMILAVSTSAKHCENTQKIYDQLEELINDGEAIYSSEYCSSTEYFIPDTIEGPLYGSWTLDVETFCSRYLQKHPLYKKIEANNNEKNQSVPVSVRCVIDCLKSIRKDDVFFDELDHQYNSKSHSTFSATDIDRKTKVNNKVFLVHGHDNEMKQSVARALEKADLEVVILHEKANEGMTIIEKLEKYTDVTFAIVLYSPCDVGRTRLAKPDDDKPRARQNVVFEHGYLNGRLGRDRVCALLKDDVEKPSDIDGVLYIPMDARGAWKSDVAREMEEAGLVFDLKALIY